MFSRLFSRRAPRHSTNSPNVPNTRSNAAISTDIDHQQPAPSSQVTTANQSPLAAPSSTAEDSSSNERVTSTVRTVSRLLQLVAALEADSSPGIRPASLLATLAMRELDEIIDSLSYEELLEVFGGACTREGLKEADIQKLPTRLVPYNTRSQASSVETGQCSICLEDFGKGESIKDIPGPCKHCFHAECLDEWLRKKASCPLCRSKVVVVDS